MRSDDELRADVASLERLAREQRAARDLRGAVVLEGIAAERRSQLAARGLFAAERRASPECTGVAASWCPVCGDCTCPEGDDRGRWPGPGEDGRRDPRCPLHGGASDHAETSDGR